MLHMAIKNDREYRMYYEELIACMKVLDKPELESAAAFLREVRIPRIKRALRAYAKANHREYSVGSGFTVENTLVCDYGMDGYVLLTKMPETIHSLESAEDFFKAFLEQIASPSQYDCTGQAFTSWYHVFKRGERYCAYHCVSFDF